ncbi:predicted protein [Streptomyces filamentosus NRRL 15998]|uniref:Predicted protein n=1 Tax=Streptomyces filamentosus NRRL 15998 TaxID=457431 RepID=D6ANX2_STRFL|nr:predicted protein [Streptomyces filamentosus NRRL 15998]
MSEGTVADDDRAIPQLATHDQELSHYCLVRKGVARFHAFGVPTKGPLKEGTFS